MKKRLLLISSVLMVVISVLLGRPVGAQTVTAQTKELNFVLLHGAGGSSCGMQQLADVMTEKLPAYIKEYQAENPGIHIVVDMLNRCYPNAVDINTWANNIADSIKTHFKQNNLILIGHSMGGKTALYMTAHNIGGLAGNIAMVATINSPVKNLSQYYFTGGVPYWQGKFLIQQDKGVLSSLADYDSSDDGKWVGTNKHWLALISAESAPISKQYDTSGVDPLPRNIDDTIVPISAQYTDGADVVYYGEHSHSDFTTQLAVANEVADNILQYVFGGNLNFSAVEDSGTFKHEAGLMPITYRWSDLTGEVPVTSGSFSYRNPSFYKWQDMEFVVGSDVVYGGRRSNFTTKAHSLPYISGLTGSYWLNDNENDFRLVLHIRAAPLTTVRVEWGISGYQPKSGKEGDRYEVEISTGTPFTDIENSFWAGTLPDDFRLEIDSQAEGPQRWFECTWRTYYKDIRSVKVIDEMPLLIQPAFTPGP